MSLCDDSLNFIEFQIEFQFNLIILIIYVHIRDNSQYRMTIRK
jgi:hypothetical protein